MYKLLNENNFRFNDAHGFPKPNSTHFLLICLAGKICKTLNDSNFAYSAFLDFQKLFETADHIISFKNWDNKMEFEEYHSVFTKVTRKIELTLYK